MHLDEAKHQAYDLVLAWKQSLVACEFGDADADTLQQKLTEAEQSITHWMLENMLASASQKARLGEWLLADYCHGWEQVENGAEAVKRIHDLFQLNTKLADIASEIDRKCLQLAKAIEAGRTSQYCCNRARVARQ